MTKFLRHHCILRFWLEKLYCGFFHSFHLWKNTQNNFSSPNFSVPTHGIEFLPFRPSFCLSIILIVIPVFFIEWLAIILPYLDWNCFTYPLTTLLVVYYKSFHKNKWHTCFVIWSYNLSAKKNRLCGSRKIYVVILFQSSFYKHNECKVT